MNAAVQNVRHAVVDDALASSVCKTHGRFSVYMDNTFEKLILTATDTQLDSLNAAEADSDLCQEDEAVGVLTLPFLGDKISVSWLDDNH